MGLAKVILTVAAAVPSMAQQAGAQELPPHLTAEEMAKLRRLLAQQERSEDRTPAMIDLIRERLRNGARRG